MAFHTNFCMRITKKKEPIGYQNVFNQNSILKKNAKENP